MFFCTRKASILCVPSYHFEHCCSVSPCTFRRAFCRVSSSCSGAPNHAFSHWVEVFFYHRFRPTISGFSAWGETTWYDEQDVKNRFEWRFRRPPVDFQWVQYGPISRHLVQASIIDATARQILPVDFLLNQQHLNSGAKGPLGPFQVLGSLGLSRLPPQKWNSHWEIVQILAFGVSTKPG